MLIIENFEPNEIYSEINGVYYKVCSQCGECKQFCEFGKCSKSKYGIKHNCLACRRKENKEYAKIKRQDSTEREIRNKRTKTWREETVTKNPNYYKDVYTKNPERAKNNQKKYYKNNTEKCLNTNRNWRKNNYQAALDSSNNWKKNNKERCKKKHREWVKKNTLAIKLYNQQKRALKKERTVVKFTKEQFLQRMSMFNFCCAYCSGPFEHIDHVIPLSKGGLHCLSNLRPSCAKCNLSKNNKMPKEWFKIIVKNKKVD